jgi:thiamine kinase-like enzyme
LLESLGDVEITPPIAHGGTSDGALLTCYLSDAKTWSAADAREAENITRLAERLRELHRVAYDLPPFFATRTAENYCHLAEKAQRLTTEQRQWGRELASLARAYDADSHPATLCHNDLVAANILDDGRLWLIDFEYAVLAEPILDLASVAGMNDFSAEQQICLVDAYYPGAAWPFKKAKFSDVVRLLQLISYFWAVAECRHDDRDVAAKRFVENLAAMLR